MHIFINSEHCDGSMVMPYENYGSGLHTGALIVGFYTGDIGEYFVATLDFRPWPETNEGSYGHVLIWKATGSTGPEGTRYEVCNDLEQSPTMGDLIPWHVTRTSHGA